MGLPDASILLAIALLLDFGSGKEGNHLNPGFFSGQVDRNRTSRAADGRAALSAAHLLGLDHLGRQPRRRRKDPPGKEPSAEQRLRCVQDAQGDLASDQAEAGHDVAARALKPRVHESWRARSANEKYWNRALIAFEKMFKLCFFNYQKCS